MQTKATIEPSASPAPAGIPEPLRVHHETVAAHQHRTALATADRTTGPVSLPGRPRLASGVLAKLVSAIRGDKYMVDAYPPARHGAAAERAATGSTPDAASPHRVGRAAGAPETRRTK